MVPFCGPAVVRDGRLLDLPGGVLRLVVYVVLQDGRVERRTAAGVP